MANWLTDLFGGGGGGPSASDLLWQQYYQGVQQAQQNFYAQEAAKQEAQQRAVAQAEEDQRRREAEAQRIAADEAQRAQEEQRRTQSEQQRQTEMEQLRSQIAEERARAEADQQRLLTALQPSAEQPNWQIDFLNQLRADQAAKESAAAAREAALDPTATRQAALATVGGIFGPEFESRYVPETLIDPYAQAAYAEQRGTADELINRMLSRGVLTETGATAARGELERQAPRIRAQLSDIGQSILEAERGKIGDIAGRAREAASTLAPSQPFDIAPYSTSLSTELGRFSSGLSDVYRSRVPEGLFDVSTLGAIGGTAQGAGNRPWVPDVMAEPEEEQKPVQKRTATVF